MLASQGRACLQQRGLPAKSSTGTCFGVLFQVCVCRTPLAIVYSSRFVSFFHSTHPYYFCFVYDLFLDFLTKLILFIYSTLFSLLTGFAAYIFATHHLHSPYGYVIGILSSIIPYYITGFFTHIMAITYGTKSFLLCIAHLFLFMLTILMNTRLTLFFFLMNTFVVIF